MLQDIVLISVLAFCAACCVGKPAGSDRRHQVVHRHDKRTRARATAKTCPDEFDFQVGDRCFKYADAAVFQHAEARAYCEQTFAGGRLARLDTRQKMDATVRHLHKHFAAEDAEGGAPSAWFEGRWLPGTRRVLNADGSEERRPRWMGSAGSALTWPNTLFGADSVCLVVGLWQPRTATRPEQSGIYNMPCNSFLWTHALCEAGV